MPHTMAGKVRSFTGGANSAIITKLPCGTIFWNVGNDSVHLSLVFFPVCLFGLVRRGGLCRRAGEALCQPGLFKRAPVPHLRNWGGAHRLFDGALWPQPHQPAHRLHVFGLRPGVAGGLPFGEALSPEVVGLLRPAPQPKRLHLPAVQCPVGLRRGPGGALHHARGLAAVLPDPPAPGLGAAGGAGGLVPGGLCGDSRGPGGPQPEAAEPGVRHQPAADGLG